MEHDDFDARAERVKTAAATVGWTEGNNCGRSCLMFTLPNKHTLMAEMFDCGHRPEWGTDIEIGEYDEDGEWMGNPHAWVLHFQAGDSYGRASYAIGQHQHGSVPQAVFDLIDALNGSRA